MGASVALRATEGADAPNSASMGAKTEPPNGWRSYGELKAWLQRELGISSSYSSIYRWVS